MSIESDMSALEVLHAPLCRAMRGLWEQSTGDPQARSAVLGVLADTEATAPGICALVLRTGTQWNPPQYTRSRWSQQAQAETITAAQAAAWVAASRRDTRARLRIIDSR